MPRPLTVQTNLTPDELAKIAKKEPNPRVRQRLLAKKELAQTIPQAQAEFKKRYKNGYEGHKSCIRVRGYQDGLRMKSVLVSKVQ